MDILAGMFFGFVAWFLVRYLIAGFYTVNPDQRVVLTTFGRAQRLKGTTAELPEASILREEERKRYNYPLVQVIGPGMHWRWPWQKVYKVPIATETVSMAYDPDSPSANHDGTMLDAVTRDQLNVGLRGQIRYRVSEANLYAYLFGVKNPIAHVLGYFVSVLRQRIASFEAPQSQIDANLPIAVGVSINDIRKNLRDLNEHMDRECASSPLRYGIVLDASLITEIDPPAEVESALAAINTAHNQISSEISLAEAGADQKIVQSRRAVEIETLRAQAEVEPLVAMAEQLTTLKASGPGVLPAYLRHLRLGLWSKARSLFIEVQP